MPPFQLYVGDELVFEADFDAEEVVGVRLHTARGEVARINSPLDESKILITLDRRSSVSSNYLDLEEARTRREAAEKREQATIEEFGERNPSDEEMGIGVENPGAAYAAQLAAEQGRAAKTPLGLGGSFPSVAQPGGELVGDQAVGDPAFEGARPLTVAEVEHPNFTGNQALTGQGTTVDQGEGTPAGDAEGTPPENPFSSGASGGNDLGDLTPPNES